MSHWSARKGSESGMAYGLLVLIAVLALTAVYVGVSDAPYWAKGLVLAVLLGSFMWRYGFFVRAALGVGLGLYFSYLRARWESR